ncbi:MAG: lysozyme [Chitinophagaceae bacterium]
MGGIIYGSYFFYKKWRKKQMINDSLHGVNDPNFNGGVALSGFSLQSVASYIASFEGFSETPYWDVKQWSWGYGTAAGYDHNNKPLGTITQTEAMQDLINFLEILYEKTMMELEKPVTSSQLKALLDFGYNLGFGDLKKILININNGYSAEQVANEIKLYVYAGGSVSEDLVSRRDSEATIYLT